MYNFIEPHDCMFFNTSSTVVVYYVYWNSIYYILIIVILFSHKTIIKDENIHNGVPCPGLVVAAKYSLCCCLPQTDFAWISTRTLLEPVFLCCFPAFFACFPF